MAGPWFLLIICTVLSFLTFVQSQTDEYDCDQAPPLGVEPLTCCKISKPFGKANFPDCFVEVGTVTNEPPADLNDEDELPPKQGVDRSRNGGRGNGNRVNGNRENGNRENENRKDENRESGNRENGKNENENRSSGESKSHGDQRNFGDWTGNRRHPWRSHGHRHYRDSNEHHDFHRFGFEGGSRRHRRQAVNRTAAPTNCAIECIFNQTKILTNNRFDRDIALQIYADYYKEIPIVLLTKTIDKCTKQVIDFQIVGKRRRNGIKLNRNGSRGGRRCRNGSGLFAACFNREIYRNCPASLDDDSDDCGTLRTFIESCSPIREGRELGFVDNVDVDEDGNIVPDDI